MKHLGLAAVLALALPFPAGALEPFTTPLEYTSLQSDLSYLYDTTAGQSGGDVTRFRLTTSYGEVLGRVTYRIAREPQKIEMWLKSTPQSLTVTTIKTVDPEIAGFQLEVVGYGVVYYGFKSSTGELVFQGSTIQDCSGLQQSSLWQALIESTNRFQADAEAKASLRLAVPDHEIELYGSVALPNIVARVIDDCRAAIERPQNCLNLRNFKTCQECCARNNRGFAWLCLGASSCVWAHPICAGISVGCGVAGVILAGSSCEGIQCEGQPGDPNCQQPPPCTQAGGACQGACISGQRHLCGACTEEIRPECCSW